MKTTAVNKKQRKSILVPSDSILNHIKRVQKVESQTHCDFEEPEDLESRDASCESLKIEIAGTSHPAAEIVEQEDRDAKENQIREL